MRMGSRGDDGEGQRCPKRKINLLNGVQVRNGRRVVDEGDRGTATFDRRMAKIKGELWNGEQKV